MQYRIHYIVILNVITGLVFLSTFNSCKKDNTTTTTPPTPTGTVYFHLHTDIDTNEVEAGAIAMDASGRYIMLDLAQFYVSGIKLKKSDGSWVSMDNVYLLKTIAEEVYLVGTVAAGNYLAPSFDIGVDATANLTTPSSHSSGALSDASMWFGSTAQGYKFVDVQGMVDTIDAPFAPLLDSTHVNIPFSYQLGTSAMLKNITLPDQVFSVVANQFNYVHIIADYGKLLQGIDIKSNPTATPFSSNAWVAAQIANNISTMFRYE